MPYYTGTSNVGFLRTKVVYNDGTIFNIMRVSQERYKVVIVCIPILSIAQWHSFFFGPGSNLASSNTSTGSVLLVFFDLERFLRFLSFRTVHSRNEDVHTFLCILSGSNGLPFTWPTLEIELTFWNKLKACWALVSVLLNLRSELCICPFTCLLPEP